MDGIFVSYRRQDSAGHARALYDRLRTRFGKRVFMDVEGIDAGVDFVDVIEKAVGSCKTLLVLIGREWSTVTDDHGQRRLDDPHDFIRLEVATALDRNVVVVPVLLEGAKMPPAASLPPELAKLARRQAIELRDNRWDADVDALLERLGDIVDEVSPPPQAKTDRDDTVQVRQMELPRRESLADARPASIARKENHQPPAPRGPKPNFALIGTIGGLVILLGAIAAYFTSGTRSIQVPNVVGQTMEVATERLRSSGLEVGETAKARTLEVPPNHVIRQAPAAGKKVDSGSAVKLMLAERPPRTVPNVVNKPIDAARAELNTAGFSVREVKRQETEKARPGVVLGIEPAPGTEIATDAPQVDLVVAVAIIPAIVAPKPPEAASKPLALPTKPTAPPPIAQPKAPVPQAAPAAQAQPIEPVARVEPKPAPTAPAQPPEPLARVEAKPAPTQPTEPIARVEPKPAPAPPASSQPTPSGIRAAGEMSIQAGSGMSVSQSGEVAYRNADVALEQRVDPRQTLWFLSPLNRASVARVRQATKEECQQARYYNIEIPTVQLSTGSIVCVKNANGVLAALQVKQLPRYGYYQIDVSYVVWQ